MYRLDSYEILSEGVHETVVANPHEVLRIRNDSIGMSPQERTAYADGLSLNLERLDLAFKSLVFRQQVQTGPNPAGDGDAVMIAERRMDRMAKPPLFEGDDVNRDVYKVLSEQEHVWRSLGDIASVGYRLGQISGLMPDTDKIKIVAKDEHDTPQVVISGPLVDRLEDKVEYEKHMERIRGLYRLARIKHEEPTSLA